ncbi:MAG: phosphoenolpyruvate-utilizing protein [Actinomycetia bacterium]|nr:phosphoenolpyruvate-utilizing protein [Actinomycetes bacterium]
MNEALEKTGPWRDWGGGITYVGTPPSREFPLWTRGNAGEVFPQVVYPLSYTSSFENAERAFRRAAVGSGAVTESDLGAEPFVGVGCFAGYTYLNMSFGRLIAMRAPGGDAAAMDRVAYGISDAPEHVPSRRDRSFMATLRILRGALRTLRMDAVPELDADKERVERWRAGLPDPATATDEELLNVAQPTIDLAAELFDRHIWVSNLVGTPFITVQKICEDKLGDAAVAMILLGGVGEVESAAPATAIWDLGRLVADDPALTAQFDQGVPGLADRLANDPSAAVFNAEFAAFLIEFGCRGPNEWEPACEVWGTNPGLPLALIDRMRSADPESDPRAQAERLAAERETAVAEALTGVKGLNRWMLSKALTSAAVLSQGRERAKTTVVRAIHESRIRTRELGRRAAAAGGEDARPDDIWYVTIDELGDYVADPAAYAEPIAERRAARDYLAEREPPFLVQGSPPPVDEWPLRGRTEKAAEAGEVLTGIAGSAGITRGTARVVHDPAHPGALGPGDVLIAPYTDPSWTPLFVPAQAVVVDVGAQLSHAVIVSRELGIPCVVSVTDATLTIPDGAIIEVNGTTGEVTVVELPA